MENFVVIICVRRETYFKKPKADIMTYWQSHSEIMNLTLVNYSNLKTVNKINI